jgi:hypothetical protein
MNFNQILHLYSCVHERILSVQIFIHHDDMSTVRFMLICAPHDRCQENA